MNTASRKSTTLLGAAVYGALVILVAAASLATVSPMFA